MRWPTPICGAASPAPFLCAIVSFMSWRSACNSGVPNDSTGLARSRSTGCPILRTSRIAMLLHHLRDDEAEAAHCVVDHAGDVVERDRARAGAAPGRRIHHHGEVRIGEAQLAR